MTLVAGLNGAQLDYWVARAAGWPVEALSIQVVPRTSDTICVANGRERLAFSTDAKQGHELIEREQIELLRLGDRWLGRMHLPQQGVFGALGKTALIAAMRAFVASKYGDNTPD